MDYALERTESDEISASFRDRQLTVNIPRSIADEWASSETVGIEETLSIGPNGELHILIEKDFVCLTRDDEDPNEHYPHPKSETCL